MRRPMFGLGMGFSIYTQIGRPERNGTERKAGGCGEAGVSWLPSTMLNAAAPRE